MPKKKKNISEAADEYERDKDGFIKLKLKPGKSLIIGVKGKRCKPVYAEPKIDVDELAKNSDGRIIPVGVGDYVLENGILHAANMNVGRSLPLIEDGMKSVERRVLYTMFSTGLKSTSNRAKVSSVVGNMIATVYPHGDQAAADTIYRLGRKSAMMFPYVDGKGNYGDIVTMEHAAARYGEARLSAYAMDCFFSESDVNTPIYDVQASYNFDSIAPKYLPTKYPNVLMNWNMGIGKGAFMYIAAFNPTDVFEATLKLLDNPDAKIDIYPDFQVPVDIINKADLKGCFDMYSFPVKIRGRYHTVNQIGKDENGRQFEKNSIVFTSCPINTYGKAIEDAIIKIRTNEGKSKNKDTLPEILDVHPATAVNTKTGKRDPNMLELSIDYERGYDPNVIADKLFKMTPLSATIPVKYNLIQDNKPEKFTPRKIALEWIKMRKDQKRRYFQQKVRMSSEERDAAEALLIIYRKGKIEDMINTIRKSKSDEETIRKLADDYGLTEHQAYILSNKRLKSLNVSNIDAIKAQFDKACQDYEYYVNMCSDKAIIESIREDLKEGLKKYGRPRMARLINLKTSALDIANDKKVIVYNREMYYCITSFDDLPSIANKIDKTYEIGVIHNNDTVAVIGTNGKMKRLDGFAFGYNTSGVAFAQMGFPRVARIVKVDDSESLLAFVTKNGYGKLMHMSELTDKAASGKIMKIAAEDELIAVTPVTKNGVLGMVQDDRMYYLHVKEMPVLKKASAGNWLLKNAGDVCLSTCIHIPEEAKYLMIYGESGYAKVMSTMALVPKTSRKSTASITMSGKMIYYALPLDDEKSTVRLYTGKGKTKLDVDIDKRVSISANGKSVSKTALSTSIAMPTKLFKVGKHEFYRVR